MSYSDRKDRVLVQKYAKLLPGEICPTNSQSFIVLIYALVLDIMKMETN